MNGDGKLYIVITDKRQDTTSGGGSGGGGGFGEDKNKNTNLLQHQINNFLISTAKQIVNTSISNIGNFTGDFQTQRHVQNLISSASKVAGIITSFAINPVLGTFSLAGTAISDVSEVITTTQKYSVKNYQIAQLRDYSGLDNGSR